MSFRLISFRFMKALWVDVPRVSLHQRASSNHARPQEQLRKQTEDATSLNKANDTGVVVKG